MKPTDELREVETCLRSTLYITSTGSMYRNYHDTGAWEYVHPRCDNNGKMCGYKNKSIQRLIAEAWLEPPVATTDVGLTNMSTQRNSLLALFFLTLVKSSKD